MRFVVFIALLLLFGFCAEKHSTLIRPLVSGCWPIPASQPRISPQDATAMIHAAALKHNVPAAFVKSIIAAESDFYPGVVSDKGAIGLMQLMPETAQQYGVDPTIPAQNVDGGAHYLRVLMTRYQRSRDWLRRVIAAYNAGPGVVDHYRGVPPYKETRAYVGRVLNFLRRFEKEG
jgi:soluble lytic murein transglycosylase-like protein